MRQLKLFTVLLLLCSPLCLFGQIGEQRSAIALGVNAGMNFNAITFNPTISQKRLIGPNFGATLRVTSEKYFSMYCALQVEINYSQLGWKEDILSSNSTPLPDKYERRMNYVQIPFLARLSWGKEKKGAMVYFIAGPQLGYCFGDNEKRSAEWTEIGGVPDRPNGMYLQYGKAIDRKFDYGITGGLGVELNTKVGHFMIDGRYYFGLGDIFDNGKKDIFGRSAHGTIGARVTYLFDIKK